MTGNISKCLSQSNSKVQLNPSAPRKIDGHVHLVGDGSSGSGCWFKLTTWFHRIQARIMLREAGVPPSTLSSGMDEAFVDALKRHVTTSSLDAVVLLAQDIPYSDSGEAMPEKGGFYVPNDYLLKIVAAHPDIFIPAISIHPGRADAMDELEKCIEAGARVLKLLPNCLNVDCSDKRHEPFWARMAEAKMILLAHTGGEMTLPVVKPEYADPCKLVLPLECGVKVIAAHGAGRSGLWDPDYTEELISMFQIYPHLYADNSALASFNRARTNPKLLREEAKGRVIHGSDFPVPILGAGPWLMRQISWEALQQSRREKNVIERDYQLKLAMGYEEDSFTRMDVLLREALA